MDETYDRPTLVDPHRAAPATPNETRSEPSEADAPTSDELTIDELEAAAGGVPECDIGCAPTTTNQCTGNMQCN